MARHIGGMWKIIQEGGTDSVVHVSHVAEPDGAFTVDAVQDDTNVHGFGGGHVSGDFVGFVINWDDGTAGAYSAGFDGPGMLRGATFDLKNPGSSAEWHSDKPFS